MVEQPEGQFCAVVGGIMAVRMNALGVKGVLVNGRIRDVEEMRGCGIPVRLGRLLSWGTQRLMQDIPGLGPRNINRWDRCGSKTRGEKCPCECGRCGGVSGIRPLSLLRGMELACKLTASGRYHIL